jgi:hypothetical protein
MPRNGKTLHASTKSLLQAYQTIALLHGTFLAHRRVRSSTVERVLMIDTVLSMPVVKPTKMTTAGVTNSNSASVYLARGRRVFVRNRRIILVAAALNLFSSA